MKSKCSLHCVLLLALLLGSCTIHKRHYRDGYYARLNRSITDNSPISVTKDPKLPDSSCAHNSAQTSIHEENSLNETTTTNIIIADKEVPESFTAESEQYLHDDNTVNNTSDVSSDSAINSSKSFRSILFGAGSITLPVASGILLWSTGSILWFVVGLIILLLGLTCLILAIINLIHYWKSNSEDPKRKKRWMVIASSLVILMGICAVFFGISRYIGEIRIGIFGL